MGQTLLAKTAKVAFSICFWDYKFAPDYYRVEGNLGSASSILVHNLSNSIRCWSLFRKETRIVNMIKLLSYILARAYNFKTKAR